MVSQLRRLEAESIHILRELVGEFRRPVMLYSIGKGSSVMLHLARKAFHLTRPPFPLSNWTETDVWRYIESEGIEIVFPYLAASRPVVERDGMLIMRVDERMALKEGRPSACAA